MRSIVEELRNRVYWDITYNRMMEKDNLSTSQKITLMEIYNDTYIEEVINKIVNKEYKWSICEKQLLNKFGTTKKRVVYIYDIEDRYLLGVLYRCFSNYFKESISNNVFSYKHKVKTVTAIEYLMSDNQLPNKYGLKLDISSYFNSVSEEYLHKVVDELTVDEPEVRHLIETLLFDKRVMFRGKEIEEYKALIAGTAFSSFLANYCLKDIDNFITEKLHITYARYSDDIICFADTLEELNVGLEVIKEQLDSIGLKINTSKYEWFQPGEEVTFLGLKLHGKTIDVSENSVKKFKRKIRYSCRYGRNQIETKGIDPYKMAKRIISRYNYRIYKCYIQDASKFGWAYYAFRYINTTDSIRQLDFYLRDRIRQMITGKNNSANIRKVSDDKLKELGYISLCDMYNKFKYDFDMYCDTVDLIR